MDLLVTSQSGVVTLTLNRPEKRNALSESLVAEFDRSLAKIAQDPSARVIVLTANGPVFCAGHDLSEMTTRTPEEYRNLFAACGNAMQRMRKLPQPIIARVAGMATGAGCQLVAACDLVVAADTARFATPGVKLGLFCTTPMVPLVRSVSPKFAMEMLLTGTPITAERAMHAGLVNRVVPMEQLDSAVKEFTDAICATSPLTVRIGKQAFYDQLHLPETIAWEKAVPVMADNATRHDAQEGMTAFVQKRVPQWRGE